MANQRGGVAPARARRRGGSASPAAAIWEYEAHTGSGIQKATIQANDEREVRQFLRDRGFFPISIRKQNTRSPRRSLRKLLEELRPQPREGEEQVKAIRTRRKKKVRFFYKAVPKNGGDPVTGEILADNERQAREVLHSRNLVPANLEIKQFWHELLPKQVNANLLEDAESLAGKRLRGQSKTKGYSLLERIFPRPVPLKEMVLYTQQLSSMMEAGLSVVQTLSILAGSITNRRLLEINAHVQKQIQEGNALGDAYGDYIDMLPVVFTELITIGEKSGSLESTIKRLADFLDRQLDTRKKIRQAVTYPAILLVIISLIVVGLMIFVVPTFIKLFEEFKLDLPWTTRLLLGTSWFMTHFWWTLPISAGVVVFTTRWFLRTPLGRRLRDKLEYKLPLFGKLFYKVTIARLLHNLAIFMASGVPVTMALDSCRQAASNYQIAIKLEEVRLGLLEGARLSALFEASGLFPPLVNQLLITSEETGATEELLIRSARYVDQEVDSTIKGLTAGIEPIMTVIVALVVLFILGSLYLPLAGLMSGQGHVGY